MVLRRVPAWLKPSIRREELLKLLPARVKVLYYVARNNPVTDVSKMSRELGIGVSSAYDAINRLIEEGLVRRDRRGLWATKAVEIVIEDFVPFFALFLMLFALIALSLALRRNFEGLATSLTACAAFAYLIALALRRRL